MFKKINGWFNANLLSLNFSKTYFMQFQFKNISTTAINIHYYNNKIVSNNTTNLKFLGLLIDNKVSWKSHIEMITPKYNQACCMIRITSSILSLESLEITYYAYFIQL